MAATSWLHSFCLQTAAEEWTWILHHRLLSGIAWLACFILRFAPFSFLASNKIRIPFYMHVAYKFCFCFDEKDDGGTGLLKCGPYSPGSNYFYWCGCRIKDNLPLHLRKAASRLPRSTRNSLEVFKGDGMPFRKCREFKSRFSAIGASKGKEEQQWWLPGGRRGQREGSFYQQEINLGAVYLLVPQI